MTTVKTKLKPKDRPYYVNNKDFTAAVVEHCGNVNAARERGEPDPMVPDYVARCVLRICEGLSHKSNFVRYTYREEMVMDAVENCLRVLDKATFNANAATRKGPPNAFGYFTHIAWYAMVRRITKEKKQQDVKLKFIAESGIDQFMIDPDEDPEVARIVQSFVDNLREKIEAVKERDDRLEEYKKEQKKKVTNKKKSMDSDLMEFLEE